MTGPRATSPDAAEDSPQHPEVPAPEKRAGPPDGAAANETPGPPDGAAAEIAALEDQLRRALADLDNMRKRYAREVARERDDERARVAAEWLPVVDDLDRALDYAADPAVLEGLRVIRDQSSAVLGRLGFPRFDDVGVAFDPTLHEAVGTTETDGDVAPGTVVAVVRPGYGREGAVLRPASVVVARGSA
jgi:molecular chaperone GrpE